MRRGFGLIGLVVTTILLVIVGVIAYNVGWSDGVNTHLPSGAVTAPYYYGPGFHPLGFGLFAIFWFFLIIFGFFWLLRLLFWGAFGRRMWGGGGWGHGHGMGPGRGWGSFEERAQAWHRQQHGETPPPSAGSGTAPPPPSPPDSRSV